MAETTNASGLRVQQWDDSFFEEYVRGSRFKPYYGTDENSVIQMKEDLTKKKGDRITYALVNRLTNDATTGVTTLVGNEEDLVSRSHMLTVDKRRNAVVVPEMAEQKSAIPLRNAAKAMLKSWALEDTRNLIIKALNSFRDGTTVSTWTTGAELQALGATLHDQWQVDNADRILFGAYGTHATDFSAGHAQVDNTSDKMTATLLTNAKIMAGQASPKVTPIRIDGDEEWYVCFMHSYQLRDLVLSDTTFQAAQREARERSKDNPLFRGADYLWNGIIIKEIPEMPLVAASSVTGGASIVTACAKLCGAQALGFGIAKRWASKVRSEDDYGDKAGVGIEQIYGIEKLCFGSGTGDTDDLKQNGVVDIWTAAVA